MVQASAELQRPVMQRGRPGGVGPRSEHRVDNPPPQMHSVSARDRIPPTAAVSIRWQGSPIFSS